MQINEFKKTKTMKQNPTIVTVIIYAEGVTGVVVEVERYDGIGLKEALSRADKAFETYENPQIEIYKA